MVGESQEAVGVGAGAGPSSNKMPTLEEYGTNLTTQATEVYIFFSLTHSPSLCAKQGTELSTTLSCYGVKTNV